MKAVSIINILFCVLFVRNANANRIDTEINNVKQSILVDLDSGNKLLDDQVNQTVLVLNVINRAVDPGITDAQLIVVTFPIYQQFLTFVRRIVIGTTTPAIEKLRDSRDRLATLLSFVGIDEDTIGSTKATIDCLWDGIPCAIGEIVKNSETQFNGLLQRINGLITQAHVTYAAQRDYKKYRTAIEYALESGEKGNLRLMHSLEYNLVQYYGTVLDKLRGIVQNVLTQ